MSKEKQNIMAAPKIAKVVVNMGTGSLLKEKGAQEKLAEDLARITGQKPAVRKANKSVAGFNVRAGMPVGLVVTLRGARAMNFLKKLFTIILPRLRDFRGVSTKSFDQNGNYTLGIFEHTVFPEIDLAKVDKAHGMEITMVTTAKDPVAAKEYLEKLGMPFEKG